MSKKYNLLNHRFGKLLVVDRDMNSKGIPWKCICDCGNIVYIPSHRLTSGVTKSCGCANPDSHMLNLSGKTYGRLTALAYTGRKTDGNRGSAIWKCQCTCGNFCEVAAGALRSGSTQSCGCLLTESRSRAMKQMRKVRDKKYVCDTDIVGLLQEPRRNCSSGVVGINYDSSVKLWKAIIQFQKKRYYLGSSSNKDDVIKLRREAE
ncbi:MAG: hypothetical protein GX103_00075 [Bacteroidales bacterium]|nr:hypothetical protein [Bacteroidales bacterium]